MNAAINKTVRCCVHCNECRDCYTFTIYELRDLLNAIRLEVANYAKAFTQKINAGYACFNLTTTQVDDLLRLKETITRYYHSIRTKTMSCLCDTEFQRVKEKVGKIIDLLKCSRSGVTDIWYDYSGYDQWVATNPTCVSYDVWEKGMVACAAPTLIISVSKEEKPLRTLYAIATKDSSKCIIKLFAYANKAKCESRLSASVTNKTKCNIELKALVQKHKCDLSFDIYSRLLGCGLSLQAVSTILGCGGKFILSESGSPLLKVGAKTSKVDDVIKLAGGTWQDMDEKEFNELYG